DAQPVALAGHKPLRGGTAIVSNQSACPFRAFATHRLNIAPLDETTPGIDPARKGSLIHLALEYIWTRLESRAALASLTETQRCELIAAGVAHAWQEYHVPVDTQSRGYEQTRMRQVLAEWLEIELQRPDFRVLAIEQTYTMHLPEASGYQFVVRIKADRLDQDASGRRILIDYKTGARQSVSKWLGERMEEPQLPQYALAAGLGMDDAVSFARLRSGDMGYEGLSGADTGIRGIMPCDGKRHAPDDWQQVLNDWRSSINALAQEFVDGRCDVMPRNAHACRYCGLEAVCRIDETGFDTTEDPEDGT
ncbi:MAG: PD-(D/E)XK nuclease family protein, partial [Mariprofundaceae bacterium]